MPLIKKEQYGSNFVIDFGDDTELTDSLKDQLSISASELASAINSEQCASELFGHVLRARSHAQRALIEQLPAQIGAHK
jgi:hypothetical protein